MRVVVASKFWYRRGGLERVMFDEIASLERAGHEVAHFSTTHASNDPSPWSDFFVPYLELGSGGDLSAGERLHAAARMFSNAEAARRFASLVRDFKPDLVHIHGIHRQLSPSILDVARRCGLPVVQTLHDYHHVCPADVLLRGGTMPCHPRACARYSYLAAVTNRCVRGSLAASTLSAAETSYQRLRHAYERSVSRFISPSRFLAEVMADGGWEVPCDIIPNAVPLPSRADTGDEYVLFAGRLSREKGLSVFLEAAKAAGVRVKIAGEGPLEAQLREDHPWAEFLGRLDGAQVQALMGGAIACVVPSVWFENAPLSVLEPMAAGVPVIASRIGGIPELIEDRVHGLLVEPGDAAGIADAIRLLKQDRELARSLGDRARERIATEFSPESHLSRLMQTYEAAIATRRSA